MELLEIRQILSWLLLVPGAAFCVIGGIGLLRFPDAYTRMHGAGMVDTLGVALILLGLMVEPAHWTVTLKLAGILFFLYVTSSTATHALIHAAYTDGQRPLLAEDAPEPRPPAERTP